MKQVSILFLIILFAFSCEEIEISEKIISKTPSKTYQNYTSYSSLSAQNGVFHGLCNVQINNGDTTSKFLTQTTENRIIVTDTTAKVIFETPIGNNSIGNFQLLDKINFVYYNYNRKIIYTQNQKPVEISFTDNINFLNVVNENKVVYSISKENKTKVYFHDLIQNKVVIEKELDSKNNIQNMYYSKTNKALYIFEHDENRNYFLTKYDENLNFIKKHDLEVKNISSASNYYNLNFKNRNGQDIFYGGNSGNVIVITANQQSQFVQKNITGNVTKFIDNTPTGENWLVINQSGSSKLVVINPALSPFDAIGIVQADSRYNYQFFNKINPVGYSVSYLYGSSYNKVKSEIQLLVLKNNELTTKTILQSDIYPIYFRL